MSLDGFLTLISILVAAFALVKNSTRRRLSLMWGAPALLLILSLSLILYLQYYDYFALMCPEFVGNFCENVEISQGTQLPRDLSFLVVLVSLVLLVALARRKSVHARDLPRLAGLVAQQIKERKYSEAVDILDPNILLLERALNRTLRISKIRSDLRLRDSANFTIVEALDEEIHRTKITHLNKLIAKLYRFLPDGSRAENAAQRIIVSISTSPDFIDYLVVTRLNFALRIMSTNNWRSKDLIYNVIEALMNNRHSAFYLEISQNDIHVAKNFNFDTESVLLGFLFNDSNVAYKLGIWRPVGEYYLKSLQNENNPKLLKWLNAAYIGNENESGQDLTSATISFFQIMIRASAFHNITWHMWLFYFKHFLSRMLELYDIHGDEVSLEAEFSIRMERYIYQIIRVLCDSVELMNEVDVDSVHATLENTTQYQNGNIPKSAAICLADCLSLILNSDKVRTSFKKYMVEVICGNLKRLRSNERSMQLYTISIDLILSKKKDGSNRSYVYLLQEILIDVDVILRSDIPEFEVSIENILAA